MSNVQPHVAEKPATYEVLKGLERSAPWPRVPLIEAVDLNPKPDRSSLSDNLEVSFVPMAAVEAGTGAIDTSTVRRYGEVKKGYTYFRDGDVLFAKITPCMENGKMAVARQLRNGIGFGSTEFHVLRPRDDVDAQYVYHFVSSKRFRAEAAHHMTGAVGQKRVPAAFLEQSEIALPPIDEQRRIVAEIEMQFSRLNEAVAQIERIHVNLKRYERSTIETMTAPDGRRDWSEGTIGELAQSLDHMRRPVNKVERARRGGEVPYLGANGRTGWIDQHLFDEELVLVVEDETFVGRITPFCYFFSGKCWVNNHAHVLRVRPERTMAKYLALALSYYPFTPLTTGSTGRRKLTKKALMDAPLKVPGLSEQRKIVADVERRLSVIGAVKTEIDANHERAERLRQAVLHRAYIVNC